MVEMKRRDIISHNFYAQKHTLKNKRWCIEKQNTNVMIEEIVIQFFFKIKALFTIFQVSFIGVESPQ